MKLLLIATIVGLATVQTVTAQTQDYALAQHLATYFYGAQRCGNTDSWCHGACHLQDGQVVGLDLTGGWHDCGDHIKFSHTAPFTAYVLLLGYENYPESYADNYSQAFSAPPSNGIPDILDEVKIETDFLLKSLRNGTFYYQIGDSTDHASFSEPAYQSNFLPVAEGGNPRNVYHLTSGGSNVCGVASAALTLMSKHFRPYNTAYADSCIAAAVAYYQLGQTVLQAISSTSNNGSLFYPGWNWADDMALAAAELYKVTNTSTYWSDALVYYADPDFAVPDWQPLVDANVNQLVNYAFYTITLDNTYLNALDDHLQEMYDMQEPCGYMHFANWGSLTYAANTAFVAALYHKQTGDVAAYSFSKSQVDFILGDHAFISTDAPANHSFLIGYNEMGGGYSQYPHHAASFGKQANAWSDYTSESQAPGSVPYAHLLTGAMVGGPKRRCQNYIDNIKDYVTNEVCTYYNCGFLGAVAYINKIENNLVPIELLSFKAQLLENRTVQLKWETAWETNNAFFEVEHAGLDFDFEKIATITSNGNTSESQSYAFVDKKPSNGTNYYRLRQVDFDGRFEYSFIVSVAVEATEAHIEVYPNPSTAIFHIKGDHLSGQTLTLYNVLGELMTQFTPQENFYLLDLKTYPSGVYFLKQVGSQHVVKFLKIR